MITEIELRTIMAHCTGTEGYTRHWLPNSIVFTDGILAMADAAQAHWLIDIVASLKVEDKLWAKMNKAATDNGSHLICELFVNEDNTALFTVREMDAEEHLYTQEIQYTDFPLKGKTEMWLDLWTNPKHNILFLPSEY